MNEFTDPRVNGNGRCTDGDCLGASSLDDSREFQLPAGLPDQAADDTMLEMLENSSSDYDPEFEEDIIQRMEKDKKEFDELIGI